MKKIFKLYPPHSLLGKDTLPRPFVPTTFLTDPLNYSATTKSSKCEPDTEKNHASPQMMTWALYRMLKRTDQSTLQ